MTDAGMSLVLVAADDTAAVELLSPEQCRAGRAMLAWTQSKLAARAGVAESTIVYFERGQCEALPATRRRLQDALAAAGVQFVVAGRENGCGVCLARRR